MKNETEKVILTNMCMIYDNEGNVLVQDRLNPNWPGITFPGGHVEKGEAFVRSVIREVKEETGLDIENPVICGTKQWPVKRNVRYIVLFYKTNQFSGTLKSSSEGEVFWIKRNDLTKYKLASDMEDMIQIFENENLNEFYYSPQKGGCCKELL